MKYFLRTFFIVLTATSFSQTLEEIELCTALQSNQFYSEVEADSALYRILDASGLAKNFTLTQCDNIDNAAAISYKGVRYILYDKEFLQTITDYTNDWANLFILAHEVGHHLNGHSVDVSMLDIVESKTLEDKRRQELEADEFAAFILAQLGAPLSALIEPLELVVSAKDDTYSTHPSKKLRLDAINRGYSKNTNQKNSGHKNLGVKKSLPSKPSMWRSHNWDDDPFSYVRNVSSTYQINSNDLCCATFIVNKTQGGVSFEVWPQSDSEYLQVELKKFKELQSKISSKYDYIQKKIVLQYALDSNYVGQATFYSETYKDDLVYYLFPRLMIAYDTDKRYYDFDIYKFIEGLKSGSLLRIKVVSLEYYLYDEDSIDAPMIRSVPLSLDSRIMEFSLTGSSKALSWY